MIQDAPADVDVSILTVGYNSRRYLSECFGSVGPAAEETSCEILFVNNGTDDSEGLIRRDMPLVRVLESKGNVGFAEANNYLARQARGRYLLLLNPDTRLFPGAIDALVRTAQSHPQFALLGGISEDGEGKMQITSIPPLPSISAFMRGMLGRAAKEYSFAPDEKVREVPAINGGFMLVERQLWERLGGLDEGFFLYGEDVDFCRRVRAHGGLIGLVPHSRVFHDTGSGEGYSPIRMRLSATGVAHYLRKHSSPLYARLAILALWAVHMFRFACGSLLSLINSRYADLARSSREIALNPLRWMGGYAAPGADPRRED